jgi:hypothetical protein
LRRRARSRKVPLPRRSTRSRRALGRRQPSTAPRKRQSPSRRREGECRVEETCAGEAGRARMADCNRLPSSGNSRGSGHGVDHSRLTASPPLSPTPHSRAS